MRMPANIPAKIPAQGAAHKHDDLVRQVADSDAFRAAPTMRALLLYLWEHQGEPISEYAIATEALGRSADFDAKVDSTVRVQVARLRARLKEFYQANGADFPLRLSLPLGRHELEWTFLPVRRPIAATLALLPRPYLWTAAITTATLLLVCLALLFEIR